MSELKNLNDGNFHSTIDGLDLAVVDFGAEWCGPCKVFEPIVEQLSKEVNYPIFKVDVEEVSLIVKEFKIMSVPTLLFFKNGIVFKSLTGLVTKDKLRNFITTL